ncbi:MAG: hemerythrin domain-containing protein [Gemmatimonadota bacterium]|nr:MAG: hemerythrin domain-containing protein [Gemmatimonadota bacterium]
MKATTILMDEHRVIERVLGAVEVAAHRLEAGASMRPGFFIDAAEFIQGFADGCHHRKEEGVLFKVMVEHGVPTEGGPIGVMLMEHEQGRAYTRAMREAAQRLEGGDEAARAAVAQSALGYAALLRQHIAKEDNVLFPLAEQVIPTAQQAGLLEAYEQVEHEETGEGVHERYLGLAQRLEAEARG